MRPHLNVLTHCETLAVERAWSHSETNIAGVSGLSGPTNELKPWKFGITRLRLASSKLGALSTRMSTRTWNAFQQLRQHCDDYAEFVMGLTYYIVFCKWNADSAQFFSWPTTPTPLFLRESYDFAPIHYLCRDR